MRQCDLSELAGSVSVSVFLPFLSLADVCVCVHVPVTLLPWSEAVDTVDLRYMFLQSIFMDIYENAKRTLSCSVTDMLSGTCVCADREEIILFLPAY